MSAEIQGKPWWLSKGVWGPVIAIVGMIASTAGAQLDAGALIESILQLITVIGIGMGWWGRVEAKEPIDKKKVLPGVEIKSKLKGPFGH